MYTRHRHIHMRTKFRVSCKSERTMQSANLCKRAWTTPKLRKETCSIKYNFMDNANRGTIMGVFHTRKPENHTM